MAQTTSSTYNVFVSVFKMTEVPSYGRNESAACVECGAPTSVFFKQEGVVGFQGLTQTAPLSFSLFAHADLDFPHWVAIVD